MLCLITAVHPKVAESLDGETAHQLFGWGYRPETPNCPGMLIADRRQTTPTERPIVVAVQRGFGLNFAPCRIWESGSVCAYHANSPTPMTHTTMHGAPNDDYGALAEFDGTTIRSAVVAPLQGRNQQFWAATLGALVVPAGLPRYHHAPAGAVPLIRWTPDGYEGLTVYTFSAFHRIDDPQSPPPSIVLKPQEESPDARTFEFGARGVCIA